MTDTFHEPCWRYHPTLGAKLFKRGAAVPEGPWFDHQDKAIAARKPLDHDSDDRVGGSVAVTSDRPFDAMPDGELRAFIAKRDGKAPHHKTGRDKLLAIARKESAQPLPDLRQA